MIFSTLFLKGNNVKCPVCKGKFKKFLSYGHVNIRSNVLCPKCLSLERHRLMWLFLENKTDFFISKKKVLHIAPEQCFYDRFKKMNNLNYLTADLKSPLADIKFDVQKIPLPDNEYDVVICNHVLEHVKDDRKAMSEVFRVLKPGGFAILQVPFDPSLQQTYEDPMIIGPKAREEHFRQKDHYRLYGIDYPERLKDAGFKITDTNFYDQISEEKRQFYRLTGMEFMYAFWK